VAVISLPRLPGDREQHHLSQLLSRLLREWRSWYPHEGRVGVPLFGNDLGQSSYARGPGVECHTDRAPERRLRGADSDLYAYAANQRGNNLRLNADGDGYLAAPRDRHPISGRHLDAITHFGSHLDAGAVRYSVRVADCAAGHELEVQVEGRLPRPRLSPAKHEDQFVGREAGSQDRNPGILRRLTLCARISESCHNRFTTAVRLSVHRAAKSRRRLKVRNPRTAWQKKKEDLY
jgi:hypothetical protein